VTATQYTIHDSRVERTDIDIVPSASINMFRQTYRTTDLSGQGILNDQLRRAVSWFNIIFTPDRNSIVFSFFSAADAVASAFHLSETTYATAVDFILTPFSDPGDILDWPDTATLPRQLADWLGITYDQLANITGVSRAAFFYWRRPGTKPRSENAERVQHLFALTSLLVKRLGVRGARAWLHSGPTPAWDVLLAGDLTNLDRLVRQSMFPSRTIIPIPNKLPLDEVNQPLPAEPFQSDGGPRRARRAPTRRRLSPE
jgi:hypothetical protein